MNDGKTLLRELRQSLNEDSNSRFLDDYLSYSLLYKAAQKIAMKTGALTAQQTITTVAETAGYNLSPAFLRMYLKDSSNEHFIKLNDGTNDHFISMGNMEQIIYSNQTQSVAIPNYFYIQDTAAIDRITGTATSAGASSLGECILTDSAADFSNVYPGDDVHNTTDAAIGIVLKKTSSTVLITALFDGTDNDWDSGDAYVIQPQGRYKLMFSPPPSTSGYTATVDFVERPDPVFAPYRSYRFSDQGSISTAMVAYAAWLYKYRDREPNFGDGFYRIYADAVHDSGKSINAGMRRPIMSVSMKRRP